MIEGGAYISELSGKKKKSETFINSIRSIFKIRGEFGNVNANFGQPVLLNKVLDMVNTEWSGINYDDENRPPWLRDTVTSLSRQILTQINASTSVNAVNLIATILLSASKHNMDESELASLLDTYALLLKQLAYSPAITITTLSGIEQIKRVETLNLIKRKTHELGDIIYIDSSDAMLLPYYRNNSIHLFVLPSVIACCFNTVRTTGREKIKKLVTLVYPYLCAELFLYWNEDELDSVIDDTLNRMVEQGLLIRNEPLDVYTKPGSATRQFMELDTLGKFITPILELYYLTITILSKRRNDKLSVTEMADYCYLMAQRVSFIHELNQPDFADRHLINNFINVLIDENYLKISSDNKLDIDENFVNADKEARLLLSTHMRSNILQLIKSHVRL